MITLPEFEAIIQPLVERKLFKSPQIATLWEKLREIPREHLKKAVLESSRLRDKARDLEWLIEEIRAHERAEARRKEDQELTPEQRAARDRAAQETLEKVRSLPTPEAV